MEGAVVESGAVDARVRAGSQAGSQAGWRVARSFWSGARMQVRRTKR